MLGFEVEDVVTPRASPRRSNSSSLPSLVVANASSRKSFSYSKLPEEPVKLSIRKLDGSSFDVEVVKSATIADLKQAVQDIFSHMPTEGPDKISWPHVWGNFCLSYGDKKLIVDTDLIINYDIKDGDQLHFIRHVSFSNSPTKNRPKKRSVAQKHSYLPISSSASSFESEQNEDDDDNYDDMENGRCESLNDKNQSSIVQKEVQFDQLWSSTIKRTGSSKERGCHSGFCIFL